MGDTKVLRVGLHGATGRMGRLIRAEIEASPDLALAWACGRLPPEAWDADVIVDFSTPEGLSRVLTHARCPVVSGTTGVEVPQHPRVALLHAPNFSVGVAVLARLVAEARRALPEFDVEIVELHHRGKVDAPSGTALRLAAALGGAPALRHGRTGPRVLGEVGIHAVRGGDIIGEHRVFLAGPGERIELAHIATHRGVFASGALRAARWLVGRPAGRYTIEDLLG